MSEPRGPHSVTRGQFAKDKDGNLKHNDLQKTNYTSSAWNTNMLMKYCFDFEKPRFEVWTIVKNHKYTLISHVIFTIDACHWHLSDVCIRSRDIT